jgi:hypothetical protein
MLDLIMLALVAVCLTLAAAYAHVCGRLLSPPADRDIVK